jgi:diadenosine tetraphosphate (Ap4A) HIT family hydrolase
VPFDLDAYVKRARTGPCFVCATVQGHPDYPHHSIYQDVETIAFLSRHPTLWGYSIVAPKRHVEGIVSDMALDEYLRVQAVVYRVARAIAAVVPTERMYVLSLGSQLGNPHVHWHVAPLPPGVPFERQQFHALMAENGVLEATWKESDALAVAIRLELRTGPDA